MKITRIPPEKVIWRCLDPQGLVALVNSFHINRPGGTYPINELQRDCGWSLN